MSATTDDYLEIKKSYSEHLLFYRIGEFYELYFADAEIVSKELQIILNQKKLADEYVSTCGFPVKSLSANSAKLLKSGYKIAVAEQFLDSENCFVRKVSKILTPTTAIEEDFSSENNILLSISLVNSNLNLCWGDVIFGEFYTDDIAANQLESHLQLINPKEILIEKNLYENFKLIFDQIKSWVSFHKSANNSALQNIIDYVTSIHNSCSSEKWKIIAYNDHQFLKLDKNTIENLELVSSKNTSLINVIDKTVTSAGKRLLKKSLLQPFSNLHKINQRLEIVKFFTEEEWLRNKIIEHLQNFPDLEKIIGKIFLSKKITAKNLILTFDALQIIAQIAQILSLHNNKRKLPLTLSKISVGLICDFHLINKLDLALEKEAIIAEKSGYFIKENFDAKMDDLQKKRQILIEEIARLENEYQKQSGIRNLKIEFNNILGYFIEIKSDLASKLNTLKNFEIKQNLTNHIRFSSSDLKKCELEINDLTGKILALEKEILENLSAEILSKLDHIKNSITLISGLDLLSSFAVLALENNYSCPEFTQEQSLKIKDGRNPIIEKFKNNFIANDCILDNSQRIWLISGANMAGKSTFLRQNALITIMAHIGCFVPASQVKIGIIKQIFTRIGLKDNLAKHQSSFMLEMSEIAEILINADKNSLIIIDEIGNSTTNKYGIALAYGIINYLHNFNFSLALISTHHQKLSILAQNLEALQNYQIITTNKNNDIEFSHKIIPGIAADILSIDIAQMTKLPNEVIEIAKKLFKNG